MDIQVIIILSKSVSVGHILSLQDILTECPSGLSCHRLVVVPTFSPHRSRDGKLEGVLTASQLGSQVLCTVFRRLFQYEIASTRVFQKDSLSLSNVQQYGVITLKLLDNLINN